MSHVRRFDHVGITVDDLELVTAFFVGLGLEVEGRTFLEGEFLDTVIGIPDSRTQIVMLRPPGGELVARATGGPVAVTTDRSRRGRQPSGCETHGHTASLKIDRH